jgi:4-amino-4-deoxy-L-arabinose transferase-like glycosyltransferase
LDESGTDRAQYGQKLFFHPPGGIAAFWIAHRLFGERGFLVVELASFAVFFWSTVLLAASLVDPFGVPESVLTALLSGFSPIMLQVTARYWLDGPVVALATLAAALFVLALRGRGGHALVGAGVALGLASLVKPTAFLIVPGLAALAIAIAPDRRLRVRLVDAVVVLGTAGALYAGWMVWRWRVMGSPFPGWAGRPTEHLAAINAYVHYVTVERGPWIYARLLPEVHTTLVPACVLMLAQWRRQPLRRVSLALLAWIAAIVGVHVVLGYLGFSKVLRYVILVSPAVIVLFVAQAGALWRRRATTPVAWVLIGLALAGGVLEIVSGVHTMVIDKDLIIPWPWGL